MEQTDFLHVGTNSGKLKVDSMIFFFFWAGWAWSKIAMAFKFMRPLNLLYLKNECMN